MGAYYDIVDAQVDMLPNSAQRFLTKRHKPDADNETWNHYNYAYSHGFVALADSVADKVAEKEFFLLPLYMLARHSMELSLKAALVEFPAYTGIPADLEGHRLLNLFNNLCRQVEGIGIPIEHEWTWRTKDILQHIHDYDPNGDRFRYPETKSGQKFADMAITFDQLVRCHGVVTIFADASADQLFSEKSIPLDQ
ncbi:hypothetical protein LB517_24550 [Mesorhizobium sp. BR1-1-12]|uniref:hypothetical protein n=1 Tax=unclassified Mesorhizobium TaxID=325217 RepID=UPI001CCBC0F1|nr:MULTISPECIES: hypothetical protein [unclassified Mesorhizobium]MBZ9920179.1 hypothetical protein [Mesorhizobium sp. BR1-1-7]MBZ9972807.1 hypothetical protein [Mesorhizobium sp. BR1-1-12]